MKRLAALLFAMSVMTGMVAITAPAQAAVYSLTGTVASSNGAVTSGQVEFYASCTDFANYEAAARGDIVDGTLYVTVSTGTYKVLIKPTVGQGAITSWHNAKATCAEATDVTISSGSPLSLTALPGSNITGTVASTNGQVHSGTVYFYASCKAYRNYQHTAISGLPFSTYTVTIPNGDYLVRVDPGDAESALDSWHNAKATCAEATVVTVNGNATKNLMILPGTRLGGTVTSGHGPVTSGTLYFYETCQDYEDGNNAGFAWISGGYSLTIAPGTYRVSISVYDDSGAMDSWHGGSATCEDSTSITVAGSTDTEPLTAKAGAILTGSVTSTKGPVAYGTVDFYTSCAAYENRNEAGTGSIDSGTYTAILEPNTDYYALIDPGNGSGAIESWHSNSVACEEAAVIHVGGVGVDPQQQNLVARAGATVTGTVSSSNGAVTDGDVDFYASCTAYNEGLRSASTSLDNGQYSVDIPAGTYRVIIDPDDGQTAVESWHNAKATCGKADVITVSGDGTVNLVARPGSLVSGTVSSARGAIRQGSVDFYATCEDFEDGDRAASTYFSSGDPYEVTLPNGTYRARIRPGGDEPGVRSWHSGAASCAESTKVTVAGNGAINLVAAAGYVVSGDVSSSAGPVDDGGVNFYATCEDYRDYSETAYADLSSGTFSATVPNGTYLVQIVPDMGTGAVTSWHNDKMTCAQADTVTVSGPLTGLHLKASTGWDVSGTVMQGGKLTDYGQVSYYRTCEDYANGEPVDSSSNSQGYYDVSLPSGTFIVGVEFGRYDSRAFLWHNTKADCGSADTITISGPTDSANISVPATSKITGSVTAGGDPVRFGWMEFYRTCEDYQAGLRAGTTNFARGEYLAYLADGAYYVRIHPDAGAATSWHSASATCGQPIIVSGTSTADLVAAEGVVVTGTVASTNGAVESGEVEFWTSCAAYETWDLSAYDYFSDTYRVNLLPGTYLAWVDTDPGTGGRDSWHSAQAACEQAATITIGADATVNLLVRPKTGEPADPAPEPPVTPTPPPPAQPAAQSLKKPPAKLKKGKKAALAKKTRQGAKVTWKTSTKKICTVKKFKVTAKKKGKCKLSAKAPAIPGYTELTKKYAIRVK